MEAMWVNFECRDRVKFAIRPFFGGVNSISGEGFTEDTGAKTHNTTSPRPEQDYIVIPEQERLDGIAAEPGLVKQFVAAKIIPRKEEGKPRDESRRSAKISESKVLKAADEVGETFEWQMTGRDSIGGIQLQIIPQFDVRGMHAGNVQDACPVARSGSLRRDLQSLESYQPISEGAKKYNVLKSPADLNLSPGNTIHMKDMEGRVQDGRLKTIRDMLLESPIKSPSTDTLELEVYYNPAHTRVFHIALVDSKEPPVSFEASTTA
jgi:hypothetical protein